MRFLEYLEGEDFLAINFREHFFEEINIRLDNNQNKFLVLLIFIYKFIKHFKKI